MHAVGFSHFTVRSSRFDDAVGFYREVLGLVVADRPLPPGYPRAAIGSFPNGTCDASTFSKRRPKRRPPSRPCRKPRPGS